MSALRMVVAGVIVSVSLPAYAHQDGVQAEPETLEPPAQKEDESKPKDAPIAEQPAVAQTVTPQTTVTARRPAKSASSLTVKKKDFEHKPLRSAASLLEVTPGLVTLQTAGGAKANQYMLRGFDIDHGTDLALSVDGVPVNLPSHAHGQGYSDLNFVIPELVERVEITKGPFSAKDGDFATAGAINLATADHVHQNRAAFTVGNFGQYRGVLLAAPEPGEKIDGYLGAEVSTTNGPFEKAEHLKRYNVNARAAVRPADGIEVSLALQSMMAGWHASSAIPLRLVESGAVSRFGSVSPTDGGDTARHALVAGLRANDVGGGRLQVSAYGIRYGLDLFSNFTLYANDALHGDQIEQVDLRTVTGATAQYQRSFSLGPVSVGSTFGLQVRSDFVDNALIHTVERASLNDLTRAHVTQQTYGAYGELDVGWTSWLRTVLGARADGFCYQLEDALDPGASGARNAALVSPKAGVVLTPLDGLSLFGNAGRGFHSNDARALQAPTVATSYEVGARLRPLQGVEVGVVAWGLHLDSELVWVGDEGGTEASGASRRRGLELDAKWKPVSWLSADVNGTLTDARFVSGERVPLAPVWTLSAGATVEHPSGFFGAVRWTQVGARPANEDGSIQAKPIALLDASVGYRFSIFTASVEGLNLLNQNWYEGQFVSTARARGEGEAVDDLHVTPGYPLQVRGTLAVTLD